MLSTCLCNWLPWVCITLPTGSQLSDASARWRSGWDAALGTHCTTVSSRVVHAFAGLLLVHVFRCDHCGGLCHAVAAIGCDERLNTL